MPIATLRRTLLALALVVPLTAAHPAGTAPVPAAGGSFADSFAGFDRLPEPPAPADGAVDLATIEHRQPGPEDSGLGKALGGGVASYYGRQFDGRRTASGERFDMAAHTAAHRSLPFGSRVRVTNPANGASVVVRINDRGPFHGGRLIDLSQAAAQRLGLVARGSGRVELTLLD